LLLVYALGLESSEEGFIGFVAAGLFVDPSDKPLLDGELDRNGMKFPALGITAVQDLGNDFVEKGANAPVRGNDGELAAPGDNGFGDPVQQPLIMVQRELIEFTMPALAGQCVRVRRQAGGRHAVDEL